MKTRNNSKVILGCVCRSQSSTQDDDEKLHSILAKLSTQNVADVIIMGDFNHLKIDLESVNTQKSINHTSQYSKDAYLYQHVPQPTRYIHEQIPHLADLTPANCEDYQ